MLIGTTEIHLVIGVIPSGYQEVTPSVIASRYTDSSAAFTANNLIIGRKYLLIMDGANSRGPGDLYGATTPSNVVGFTYTLIKSVSTGNARYALYLITATASSISVSSTSSQHSYWTLIGY